MNKELIFTIEESDEGNYFARALGESIFAQGETMPELRTNIKDVVLCHFEEGDTPKR